MNNTQKWQRWVNAGNLPDFDKTQALLKGGNTNAPTPSPAKPSYLFTLPNSVWPGWVHNDKEHADSLPLGKDRDAAFANLNHANQIWDMEGREKSAPLACYPLLANGTLDISNPIIGSTSWPNQQLQTLDGTLIDTSTDAGVLAFCSKTRMPGPNPDAPPFPHPSGNK